MKDPYVISFPQRLLRKGDTYSNSKVLESSGKKHSDERPSLCDKKKQYMK